MDHQGGVELDPAVVARYRRFSCYNSPYPAHDRGRAIDLYPDPDRNEGLSPVAGEVLDTLTVRCPRREYAVDADHLIVIAVDDGARRCGATRADPDDGLIARILHVDPDVAVGDRVEIGDSLGPMVRSGFFGRWVDNHVHLDFRLRSQNHHRANGSLPLEVAVPVASIDWDGTGTVVETGPTHALLDSPVHPAPEEGFAAIAADCGTPLDGGLAHYGGGGLFVETARSRPLSDGGRRSLSFLGAPIGAAVGRDVTWGPIAVTANGERITGLSLFAARDAGYGAKLVARDHDFVVGDEVEVAIEPTESPIRLGGREA
ncbi:hypothetical protein ACNS7O_05740 [Haloferacaceae archaeon DSL9]